MVLPMNQTHYTIHGINGPVVKVTGGKGLAMMDMVSVGEEGLIGEVVSVDRSATTVQVYEDTAGLTCFSMGRINNFSPFSTHESAL